MMKKVVKRKNKFFNKIIIVSKYRLLKFVHANNLTSQPRFLSCLLHERSVHELLACQLSNLLQKYF